WVECSGAAAWRSSAVPRSSTPPEMLQGHSSRNSTSSHISRRTPGGILPRSRRASTSASPIRQAPDRDRESRAARNSSPMAFLLRVQDGPQVLQVLGAELGPLHQSGHQVLGAPPVHLVNEGAGGPRLILLPGENGAVVEHLPLLRLHRALLAQTAQQGFDGGGVPLVAPLQGGADGG